MLLRMPATGRSLAPRLALFGLTVTSAIACGPPPPAPPATARQPTTPPRFLKGQLHLHSNNSGDSETPPADVARWYAEHGYDFIVFTDHNRVTTDVSRDDLMIFAGMEITINVERCDPPSATSLCPLAESVDPNVGDLSRVEHLELVDSLARERGLGELSPVALQLYWTLYTGVLAFWATDKSPKQEDTLALLDESMAMFAGWLRSEQGESN